MGRKGMCGEYRKLELRRKKEAGNGAREEGRSGEWEVGSRE